MTITHDEIDQLAAAKEAVSLFFERPSITLADIFAIKARNDALYNRLEPHLQGRRFWVGACPTHPHPCVKLELPGANNVRAHIEIREPTELSFADAARLFNAYGPYVKNRRSRNMVREVDPPSPAINTLSQETPTT